jgi:hypothetical protein
VAGADEADAWVVEKLGRSSSSGAIERRTAKGGRMVTGVHFEQKWLGGMGREGGKGG